MSRFFKRVQIRSFLLCLLIALGSWTMVSAEEGCPIGKSWKGSSCVCDTGFACGDKLCCKSNQHCSKVGRSYTCNANLTCPPGKVAKGDVCACKTGYSCGSDLCCPHNEYCYPAGNTSKCVPGCGGKAPCKPPSFCVSISGHHCSYPSKFAAWIYFPKLKNPGDVLYCEIVDVANVKFGGGSSCVRTAGWVCPPPHSTNSNCKNQSWPGDGFSLASPCWIQKPREVVVKCQVNNIDNKPVGPELCAQSSKSMPWTDNIKLYYPKDFSTLCPLRSSGR